MYCKLVSIANGVYVIAEMYLQIQYCNTVQSKKMCLYLVDFKFFLCITYKYFELHNM